MDVSGETRQKNLISAWRASQLRTDDDYIVTGLLLIMVDKKILFCVVYVGCDSPTPTWIRSLTDTRQDSAHSVGMTNSSAVSVNGSGCMSSNEEHHYRDNDYRSNFIYDKITANTKR